MYYRTSLLVGCAGAAAAFFLYRRFVKRSVGYSYSPRENAYDEPGYEQLMMRIPRGCMGVIIGRKGRNIEIIQFETGAILTVFQYDSDEVRNLKGREYFPLWSRTDSEQNWLEAEKTEEKGAAYAFVRIQAPTMQQVELAVMKVRALVADWRRLCALEKVKVPREAIGYVMGKQGKNIKSINYVCRVHTKVLDETDEYMELAVSGSEHGVTTALERIENSIDRYYRTYSRGDNDNDSNRSGERPSVVNSPARSDLYEDVTLELEDIVKLREELEAEEEPW